AAAFDAENRLRSLVYTNGGGVAFSNQYIYSASGLLAQSKEYQNGALSNDTRFVRGGYLTTQERNANNVIAREYAWGRDLSAGIGGLLSLTQNGQAYSYTYDGRGDVSAVIDSSQTPVSAYAYEPFGARASISGSLDQPFGLSTKPYDAKAGLVDFG